MQTRVKIIQKGFYTTEEFGTYITDEKICREEGVSGIFLSDTGRKLYDNFDRWKVKDGILDLYAKPRKESHTVIISGGFGFFD